MKRLALIVTLFFAVGIAASAVNNYRLEDKKKETKKECCSKAEDKKACTDKKATVKDEKACTKTCSDKCKKTCTQEKK